VFIEKLQVLGAFMQEEVDRDNSKQKARPLARKISKSYLQNAGLYYLQRFTASEGHFKTVIRRKIDRSLRDHAEPELNICLTWLDEVASSFVEAGYLDDKRYAKGLVESLQLRGRSLNQMRARLKQAQIAPELIESTIEAHLKTIAESLDVSDMPSNWPQNTANVVEYIAALKCAKRRRIGPFSVLSRTEKPHDKALAILARNGFSYETAQIILQTDHGEAEAFLRYARSVL
jgi:regulatory protein